MNEGLSVAIDIIKIFAAIYGLIALIIIAYGFRSIIHRKTRIFKDEELSYGFSKKISVIDSALSKSFKPFYYHRTIPKESEEIKDDSAVLVGIVYIILGLLMLSPLIWAYIKF